MTKREIDAQFSAEYDSACALRDAKIDTATAVIAAAERIIAAAEAALEEARKDIKRRHKDAIAALPEVTHDQRGNL